MAKEKGWKERRDGRKGRVRWKRNEKKKGYKERSVLDGRKRKRRRDTKRGV